MISIIQLIRLYINILLFTIDNIVLNVCVCVLTDIPALHVSSIYTCVCVRARARVRACVYLILSLLLWYCAV